MIIQRLGLLQANHVIIIGMCIKDLMSEFTFANFKGISVCLCERHALVSMSVRAHV